MKKKYKLKMKELKGLIQQMRVQEQRHSVILAETDEMIAALSEERDRMQQRIQELTMDRDQLKNE